MGDKQSRFRLYRESPLYQLFVSLLIIIVLGSALFTILILPGKLIFGSDLSVLEKSVTALSYNDFAFLRYLLIIQDVSLLIIPSIIILALMKSDQSARLSESKFPQLKEVGLIVILAFCIFPVTTFTGQINSAMHLPDWLSGVEHWMIEKEDKNNSLIELFITSDTFWVMLLNLLLIGLMPAFAEELIFRGVFQRIFSKLFRSGHLAIWFVAFLFSTVHFQFFGFVPRFILGLVFGYLFYWSGNLWLSIISHFVNNAFPVIMVYIQGMEKLNATTEVPLWKQIIGLPIPIIIGFVILFYFRNKSKNDRGLSTDQELVSKTDVDNVSF